MKYPRSFGMDGLVKVVALGAIVSATFSSVQAQLDTDILAPIPTVNSTNSSRLCGISDGDKAAGVQIIDDPDCASGGLGCYNDHCRHCKVVDTPKSEHLRNCSSFGVDFPIYESGGVFVGDCAVTSGDAAVGISAVADPDCLYGGLGCYSNYCRFCKVETTPQSEDFLECAAFSATSVSATATPSSTPATTTRAPTPTTYTPVTTPASPESTTSAPAQTTCNTVVSSGDAAVGINILADRSCSTGGLGCIDEVCRFCKVMTTPQSATFIDCDLIGAAAPGTAPSPPPVTTTATPNSKPTGASIVLECSRSVTSGDSSVGLDIVSDITCSDGGAGCLDDICRFCKRFETVQSSSYISCDDIPPADLGLGINFVQIATIDDTETPVPSGLLVATSDIQEEAVVPGICSNIVLADGESAGGISIVLDTEKCPAGLSPGCIGDLGCKYCQKFPSNVSQHLNYCLTSAATTVLVQASGITVPSYPRSTSTNGLYESSVAQWGMGIAACLGAAAVVIGAAITMKRSLRNSTSSSAPPADGDAAAASEPRRAVVLDSVESTVGVEE